MLPAREMSVRAPNFFSNIRAPFIFEGNIHAAGMGTQWLMDHYWSPTAAAHTFFCRHLGVQPSP